MLEAMIAGQRDPRLLAQMAWASMRRTISALEQPLTGHFADHHAFRCELMLDRIAVSAQIGVLPRPSSRRRLLITWCRGRDSAPRPRNRPAGRKGASTGKGNPWLAGAIGESAIGASGTATRR